MRRSVDAQSALRAAAEARLAEESRQRLDLEQAREELAATSGEQAAVVASQDAELAQLRGELARARAAGLALAEDKARLEVGGCLPRAFLCQQCSQVSPSPGSCCLDRPSPCQSAQMCLCMPNTTWRPVGCCLCVSAWGCRWR